MSIYLFIYFDHEGNYTVTSPILVLHFLTLMLIHSVEEAGVWLRITCKWLMDGRISQSYRGFCQRDTVGIVQIPCE